VISGARISARTANADDFFGIIGEVPPGVPALVVEVPGHPAKVSPPTGPTSPAKTTMAISRTRWLSGEADRVAAGRCCALR